jgi:hypothetical protein
MSSKQQEQQFLPTTESTKKNVFHEQDFLPTTQSIKDVKCFQRITTTIPPDDSRPEFYRTSISVDSKGEFNFDKNRIQDLLSTLQ